MTIRAMTHKERIETAWSFREPDRIPVEIQISDDWRKLPVCANLARLIDEHADNFVGAVGLNCGFFGLTAKYTETVIEEKTGEYRRMKRVYETPAGDFTAYIFQPADTGKDFHWEKRFISTPSDLERLVAAERTPFPFDYAQYRSDLARIGDSAMPLVFLAHPLGGLARNSDLEEIYSWFFDHPDLMHKFLSATNSHLVEMISGIRLEKAEKINFVSYAHEMFVPPWMGHELFDEFVYPYDRQVYAAIHNIGGRFRGHCHGRCMDFLEKFADMGMDSVEPLEMPPAGDVDLCEAKRIVGKRMLLSGNIPSEKFCFLSPEEVRNMVKEAIRAGAPGGGFSLRLAGGDVASGAPTSIGREKIERIVANSEAYLLSALEFGKY